MTERDIARTLLTNLKLWTNAYDRLIGHDAERIYLLIQPDYEMSQKVLVTTNMTNMTFADPNELSRWLVQLFLKHKGILEVDSLTIWKYVHCSPLHSGSKGFQNYVAEMNGVHLVLKQCSLFQFGLQSAKCTQ